MNRKLSPEQKQYLHERGFEIIEGQPREDEPFPYVTLDKFDAEFKKPDISYNKTSSFSCEITIGSVLHPLNEHEDELVEIIESAVGSDMILDGKLFYTMPGNPIKVYVINSSWNTTAQKLAAKYK